MVLLCLWMFVWMVFGEQDLLEMISFVSMKACHVPRFTPSLSLPCLVISMKTLAMVQFQWKHLQNRIK